MKKEISQRKPDNGGENWKNETSDHFSRHAVQNLQLIYPYLLKDLEIYSNQKLEDSIILEIGCGPGFMFPLLIEKKPQLVAAIDISAQMLMRSCEDGRSDRVCIVQARAENLPFCNHTFNIIFSRGSIFFWDSPVNAFIEIKRVLHKNGLAMIGGGYGISTPEDLVEKISLRKSDRKGRKIPFLDIEKLKEEAISAGLSVSVVQKKKHGFWLLLKHCNIDQP